MTEDLFQAKVEHVKEKVKNGDLNGNITEDILILVADTHNNVCKIRDNPSVKLGRFAKEYPKLAAAAFTTWWVVTGISVVLATYGALQKIGFVLP